MKHQYVGDVSDYLKYALLRALIGEDLTLTVAWMLTPADRRPDGRRLAYLSKPKRFRGIDPAVFDGLQQVVATNARRVESIEASDLFGRTSFVSELLSESARERRAYMAAVSQASSNQDLVFFDPDNGFAPQRASVGRRGASRYLFWDEFAASYAEGHSIVVHQHFPRRPRSLFLDELSQRVQLETQCAHVGSVLTSHVAFVVAMQDRHQDLLDERLLAFSRHAAPHVQLASTNAPGNQTFRVVS